MIKIRSGALPWQMRPSPVGCPGQVQAFMASDGGVFRCISDGVAWVPVGPYRKISRTVLPASTSVYSMAMIIPGGLLGPNGELRVWLRFSHAKTSNQKLIQVTVGSALLCNFPSSQATVSGGDYIARLLNRGTQNAQSIAYNSYSGVGLISDVTGATVDTAQDVILSIGGQMAVATDQLTFEQCAVEIYPGW